MGINVTAIHNHMLYDEPRFVHAAFWGRGRSGESGGGVEGRRWIRQIPSYEIY